MKICLDLFVHSKLLDKGEIYRFGSEKVPEAFRINLFIDKVWGHDKVWGGQDINNEI